MTEEKLQEIEAAREALSKAIAMRDTLAEFVGNRKSCGEVDKHKVLEWIINNARQELKDRLWCAIVEQLQNEYAIAKEEAEDAQKAFDNL